MNKLIILLFIATLTSQHIPSEERGDPDSRRSSSLNKNQVGASIFNYGISGRTGSNPEEIPFEWPLNSGQHYIAMTAISVGSLVDTEMGARIPLVTIPFRSDEMGNSKSWEPVSQYLNPNSISIASSTDWESWPECWPNKMNDTDDPGWCNSWNSYFGKNHFIEGQEYYYRISDDINYNIGHTFYPDTTDYSRLGAGILIDCRIIAFDIPEYEDMVLQIYSIKNDGTTFLDSNSIAIWIADMVGGDADTMDDLLEYDLNLDLVWSKDEDGIGNSEFGDDPVGIPAFMILESPDGNGLTSVGFDPAGSIPINDSNQLWDYYLTPGHYWQPPDGGQPPGDYDIFIGSGYFSLDPGEQKDLILVIFLSANEGIMLEKADDIRTFYENDFLPNPSQIAQIELEVNPDFIYADGESTAIVQCHLIDYFGNPFAGKLITFEADEGDITESVITDSLGFATAEFFTSSEPESGFSLITAYSTDADYGNEESNIEINVLPANLSGNPNVPIPHDLIINYDNNTISIDWVSEVLLESNFNFNVYYNFLIYKNNEQYSMIEGMPQLNQRDSYWSRDSLYLFYVNDYFDFYSPQLPIISEYRIIWAEFDYESTCYCANSFSSDACVEGEIYCTEHLFAESITNFHVQKKLGNSGNEEDWVEIPFGFWDIVPNGTPDGIFNYSVYESDIILFLDGEDESGIRPSWQFTLINPLVDDSLHVYNQPSSGDTAFVSTRYYFDENETDENLNCYEISMFFPFTSNSDYFLPGTESIRSEEICIVTDYIPGDINLDGMIDVLDVVTIVSIILGDDPPLGYQIDIGDISGDNQLDILDIVMIIDIILS